jgi:hypothetical protein
MKIKYLICNIFKNINLTMKTKVFMIFSIVIIGSCSLSFSQDTTGKVLFFQSGIAGFPVQANNQRFYVDGKLQCKMKWDEFSVHEVASGVHYVEYAWDDIRIADTFRIEPGKTTYVEIYRELKPKGLFNMMREYVAIKEGSDSTFKAAEKKWTRKKEWRYKEKTDCED